VRCLAGRRRLPGLGACGGALKRDPTEQPPCDHPVGRQQRGREQGVRGVSNQGRERPAIEGGLGQAVQHGIRHAQ